jgi:TRAP-type mannitol/chloroaromatic compound transport system permease small subunit
MRSLLGLSRSIDALNQLFGIVAEWCVLLAVLISAANAVVRYSLNYSSNSFLEIQWYLFGAIVFLGASFTLQKNEHVRVDIIYSTLSTRGRLWIDIVGFALFLLPVTIYLTQLTLPFFLSALRSHEHSINPGGLILWPVKLVLPLGFALLTLQGVSELIKRIAGVRGLLTIDVTYEKPQQ